MSQLYFFKKWLRKEILFFLFIFVFSHNLFAQPGNNTCATATLLTSGIICTASTAGTLQGADATAAGSLPAAVCGNSGSADVWYSFVAMSQYPTITLSSVGSSLTTPRIQILSAVCNNTAIVFECSSTLITTPSIALTIGTTYYIRITTNTNTGVPSGANWGFNICITDPTIIGSRMGEVFKKTDLVSGNVTSPAANRLFDPWEITYGPDDSLWVTEAKGYKVKKISPVNGGQRTVLNLTDAASGGTFTPSTWRRQFAANQNPWPQGGMMGLAIHPDFNHPVTPLKYVYISYVHSYIGLNTTNPNNGLAVSGHLFMSRLVRFTYTNGQLISPVSLCDTLVGSNDHNSGRLIIKPVGGTNYLFYALGDMGAGQFANLSRIIKSQNINSYEGKILRFNLQPDATEGTYDQWIPNDNPYNATLGMQSAVWCNGMRNNQGFAYIPGLDKLYGSSHGPFSDDELNVIEPNKNYGHPLVIGDSSDGNYNNAKAGPSGSSLPLIVSESANAIAMGNYKNALYSFYKPPAGNTSTLWSIQYIYTNQNYTGSPGPTGTAQNVNIHWKSEAVSGIDAYTKSFIPGWRNSLLSACLKGGRVIRTKLNSSGDAIVPTDGADTITHFRSVNRFRDITISPDGKDIFVVIDSSSSTSGPTTTSPMVSACRGCLQRYTFLGYTDNAGVSSISSSINIAPGLNNQVTNGTATAINSTDNNNLWVPITDSLGNIIAEIDANGNNLGNITTTVYKNAGPVRTTSGGTPYLDRSITINVQNPPPAAVNVRFYLTAAELAALIAAPLSGVLNINDINIFKNTDANGIALTTIPTLITPTSRSTFGFDYVLKASISSFSTFYFSGANVVIPVNFTVLTGKYTGNLVSLQWKTETEVNSSHFVIERSSDARDFNSIGTVTARGFSSTAINYSFNDLDVMDQLYPGYYYRLKMFDIDGTFKYSNIIRVSLPGLKGNITLSPNPAVNYLKATIILPIQCKVDWQVIDNTGKIMMQSNALLKKGNNELMLNVNNLARGSYYLKVLGTCIDSKNKFQKL